MRSSSAVLAATGFVVCLACVIFTMHHVSSSPSVLDQSLASPIFENPEEVGEANTYLAPDQTVRALYTTIDETRDLFEQLQGALDARTTDQDCDGIHTIATEVKEAHQRYVILELQYKHLGKADRQAVARYVQDRLIDSVHQVTTGLVQALLVCEQSQTLYHQAVANIRITTAKLDLFEKRLQVQEPDCVAMQDTFHDAMTYINKFHTTGEAVLEQMRAQNMIVAADQALLETDARINPAEHSFFATYADLWKRSCQLKMYQALGLDDNGEATSSSGSASGSGSGSSDSGSGGSSGDASGSS